MHGQPRAKADTSLNEAQKLEQKERRTKKAQLFGELCKRVLEAHASNRHDATLLKMSEKLVQMNPEMYTVWNYRRAYLSPILLRGGAEAVDASAHELAVTEQALMQNPKSYATFHHRKWVVSTGFCSLERELALVEVLLEADERNFHGWGYRRAVAGMMGLDRDRELEYSRRKIEDNFSNYSAWHHRSVVLGLPAVGGEACEEGGGTRSGSGQARDRRLTTAVIEEELQFVRQACYTDPRDQSGWFYHRWLTGKLVLAEDNLIDPAEKARILRLELIMCRGVHELDSEAKWPVVIARGLAKALAGLAGSCADCDGGEGVEDDQGTAWLAGKDAAWLETCDPLRAGLYRDGLFTEW
jgi:geranylgeranyl transferase type-2 subunit alpha